MTPPANASGSRYVDKLRRAGENKNAELLKDPAMLKRLQDIDNLPNEDKNGILYALDNLLKAAKLKAI